MLSQAATSTTLSSTLAIIRVVALARLLIARRYPGLLLLDIALPITITLIPIVLGRTLGGSQGQLSFAARAGTADYVAYMLIGSHVFFIVSSSLWNIGFWIQREQQSGTLEALYLTPGSRAAMLAGVSLYGALRSLVTLSISFTLGCLLFGVNPLRGNMPLALCFLLLGIIPIQGLSLVYGALVLRFHEAQTLIKLAQWIVALMMGLYFPVSVFPTPLRWLALLFPPTWINNGVRAALLGTGWFGVTWLVDLLVVALFGVVMPLLGYAIFRTVERRVQRREGIGTF